MADDDDDDTPAPRPQMRKKPFLDAVAARVGGNKAQARAAADAVLTELAGLLAAGQEANLPPLGKLKVVKEKPGPKGRILIVRLALDAGGGPGSKGVAADGEDD